MTEGGGPGPSTTRRIVRWIGSLIGIVGVAMCITLMGKALSSVMAVGGSCASGNQPYVVANPCPTGVPAEMLIGIFGAMAFGGLFAFGVGMKNLVVVKLLWSALFLGLGGVFLVKGLPINGQGAAVGGIIAGVVFVLMGAAPLVSWLPQVFRLLVNGSSDTPTRAAKPGSIDPFLSKALASTAAAGGSAPADPLTPPDLTPPPRPTPPETSRPAGTGPATAAASGGSGDLGGELDHLAALHRSGDLSDAEFQAAKSSAIQRGGK